MREHGPAAGMNLRLVLGAAVAAALFICAAFAQWIAPHDPMDQDLLNQLRAPFWMAGNDPHFALGSDELGRDLVSRLIYGARPAVLVMLIGATLSGLLGTCLGLFAGYFGGWIDAAVSRLVEIFMSFPPMLVAIVLAAVLGPGLDTVIIAVIAIGWTRFCRVVRGEILVMRELDFVTSARAVGVSHLRLVFHELLPNLVPLLTVLFGLEMGRAIVVEAVLAFIGFSASDAATWGAIIAGGRAYIYQAWWVMALPIAVIVVSVLGLNAFGDGVRQATDPVLRR
jgi:peptide/nickel transport system permease protein